MFGRSPRSQSQSSPFVPPLPSPDSMNIPPQIPTPRGEPPPPWAHGTRSQANYPAYPSTPYNGTPFIPSMPPSGYATPAVLPTEPPGSYFPAPSMLPNMHGTPGAGLAQGLSHDYTGYPNLVNTPYAPPQQMSGWSQPGTGYSAFQQPLPPGPYGPPPGWGQFPPYATPAAPPMWNIPPQQPPPHHPPPWGHPPTPWVHPTQPPANPAPAGTADFRWTKSGMDRMNPFAEGPHYGPVLEPFLVRVVRANVKINPLLAPPNDATDDYLQWNMVFGTSNCHRSTDPRRSWIKGRGEPATHPRLSSLRIICHSFPGMITIQARDPKIGITCGEILDRISHYLYGDVIRAEYDSIPRSRKKTIYQSYQHNRSTHPNVPGGSLGDGMRRLDYLCADSNFGGIVQNDNFVKEHCGDALPCTYELKCLPSYPLTQQELRDQQQRAREAERARRARSRASSRGSGSQSETDE